jgi:hypothetical protein
MPDPPPLPWSADFSFDKKVNFRNSIECPFPTGWPDWVIFHPLFTYFGQLRTSKLQKYPTYLGYFIINHKFWKKWVGLLFGRFFTQTHLVALFTDQVRRIERTNLLSFDVLQRKYSKLKITLFRCRNAVHGYLLYVPMFSVLWFVLHWKLPLTF